MAPPPASFLPTSPWGPAHLNPPLPPQVNSAATFPITAVQFGVNRLLERLHQDKLGRDPAGLTPIGIAMAAGATSALIGCPAELLMIQQQKSGLSLGDQFKAVARAYGAQKIYKGVVRVGVGWRGRAGFQGEGEQDWLRARVIVVHAMLLLPLS